MFGVTTVSRRTVSTFGALRTNGFRIYVTLILVNSMNEYQKINQDRKTNFDSFYKLEKRIDDSDDDVVRLGDKKDRECRFCNKKEPETTFKNEAHVIPTCLGNKKIISYFECDKCNSQFSKYEFSLGAFTGIFRSLSHVRNRGVRPNYKNPKSGFSIIPVDNGNKIILGKGTNELLIDEENKKVIIAAPTQSYIPVHVYKSLVKIALSLVDTNKLGILRNTMQFIRTRDVQPSNYPFSFLYATHVTGPYIFVRPSALLYRRKRPWDYNMVPDRCLVLLFENHVYQIFIPFSDVDIYNNEQNIILPVHHIPVDLEYFDSAELQTNKYKLHSANKTSRMDRYEFTIANQENDNLI